MKFSTKEALILACIFTILVAFVIGVPTTQAQTASTAPEKALMFINDVIQPDMSKYKITLVSDIVGTPLNQSTTQEVVDYHLDANGSGPDVLCVFTNNVLTSAQLTPSSAYANNNASSTLTTNILYANLSELALSTLKGYEIYTGENLQTMTNALANVDVTQNSTSVSGDMKLTVENNPPFTDVSLKYTYNGTDYTGVDFGFKDGQFYTFMDDRSLWFIGNTDVNINETQAINIAQQYLQNYSYTLDDGTVVKSFNVTSIQATPNFYPRDNSSTIYPYWSVQLDFNQLYPGNVYAVSIGIWADTGTVFLSQPIGVEGGGPAPTPSASTSQPAQSHGQTEISPIDISLATGLVIVIAIVSAILVKTRKK